MTSRFRSNWAKEGPKSTSPTFDSGTTRSHLMEDDYRREYLEDDFPAVNTSSKPRNGSRSVRDRSVEDRNGKSRDRNSGGFYGDQQILDDESESPDRSYYRRYKEGFRCRGAEIEDSSTENRAPIGKKSSNCGVVVALATRYDLVEDDANTVNLDSRPVSSTMTNGNSSSTRMANNGSSKQVKRYEERRDRPATGSLTRERARIEDSFPAINPRTDDATNRFTIGTNDRSNGRGRERSAQKTSIRDKSDEYFQSPGAGRQSNDYGSLDKNRIGHLRERSQSPVDEEEVLIGNGDPMTRRSGTRRRDTRDSERFYSHGRRTDEKDSRSIDRRSRRHAEGRSYSPPEENDDRMPNGNCDIPVSRLERRDTRSNDEEFGSMTRRSSRTQVMNPHGIVPDHEDDVTGTPKTNGNRAENGHSKKYREMENDDNSHGRKGNSKRKNHTHHKASPEDFDVQIHRYERALRAPRRDSDLTRKSSFKDHDSDLSRKNSFEDHHRSRDAVSNRKSSHCRRDLDVARRGSSEDRDHEPVTRKSSFKNCDPELNRKSSLTSRNSIDQSGNHRNNGSSMTNRDSSESPRKNRDQSITRRKSSRSINDDDLHDRSPWKNDRHSRPLTPPTPTLDDHNDRENSRDRTARVALPAASPDRRIPNEDGIAHKYVHDHNECRSKTGDVIEGRDRFSSSSRRAVSSRSLNDSRPKSATRSSSSRADGANKKPLSRDFADEDDPREDGENDAGFSTIERNGTTVIRIRTNSESPVGHSEPRTRRRTSQQEINSTRYRKYEDEAEDEDEDDEPFERDCKHRVDVSRRDYKIGPRRLWANRDGGVQITDLDDGQPCLHCGETCPGFSPHSWRKNCTSCKCPREAHDVCHEEWVSVRARLGLKGEGPNNYVGFDPRDRGLTWAPPGLPPGKVEEYFSMLPEISVPRIGTPGERHRDRQLATQLPKQDLARAYCRHLDSQHSASADDFMAARNEIALDIGSVKEILERGHECGVCHEPLKYGSLVVSASKLGLSYHPSCFQCTQCRELLVDLAYCVHDDALYCERHYAEQLKPRCAACDELIFSGEYTKAMNKDWHSGHFCCWQCDESLTGQRYVLRDEHPYCIKCYESVFANGCEECNKIIGIDSKDLSYKDKHWHEACFLCNKCRVSLVDKQFGSKVDKIYCGNCYDAQFASRCDGCGEIFRAGTKKMEYKTRQWHEKCFCCVVCKNPIGTKSFIPREQEIYCAGCYEDKFATRCVKCNKIITSGGVTYKNEPWHRDCFTCSNCNNSLAGQRFTSRDDKPYCAECFGELFAKRCTACTKPITGIGGTRFISFEDRHWHNNCFICAGCQTSLVGRGFITDGDDIICPECAKQKLSE